MEVGTAGETTIERDEPPRRLEPELLPEPPRPRASMRRAGAWLAAVAVAFALAGGLFASLAGKGPDRTQSAIESRSADMTTEISGIEDGSLGP